MEAPALRSEDVAADAPVDDFDDFDAWVAARGPALLRLAWALTGGDIPVPATLRS